VIADATNLLTKLRTTQCDQLFISLRNTPSGSGEDKVDLGVLPHHEIVVFNSAITGPAVKVFMEGRDGRVDCDLLSFYGQFSIENAIKVPILEVDGETTVLNADKVEAEWGWVPWFDALIVPPIKWENLQLYSVWNGAEYSHWVSSVDFLSTGWTVHGTLDDSAQKSVDIPKTVVPTAGILSLLYAVIVEGGEWHLDLKAKAKEVHGINCTLMVYSVPELASTKMVIKFDEGWDQVENNPTMIFEAPAVEDIQFRDANDQPIDAPSTITVEKNVFVAGGKKEAAPPPDDDDKLSTGAIVGIAIGAVAAVGIAAACIWYFVVRPKTGRVEQE
jgi:hypothetical protein